MREGGRRGKERRQRKKRPPKQPKHKNKKIKRQGTKLTVLFLVSGKKKYANTPWLNVHATKMMYVFHWIFLMAIGHANWFRRPAALTKKL